MIEGCSCGCRVFRQINGELPEPDASEKIHPEPTKQMVHQKSPSDDDMMDDDISILVKERGVYSVNIKSLANRSSGMDPIFIQDAKGKINVILNPDPEN